MGGDACCRGSCVQKWELCAEVGDGESGADVRAWEGVEVKCGQPLKERELHTVHSPPLSTSHDTILVLPH